MKHVAEHLSIGKERRTLMERQDIFSPFKVFVAVAN